MSISSSIIYKLQGLFNYFFTITLLRLLTVCTLPWCYTTVLFSHNQIYGRMYTIMDLFIIKSSSNELFTPNFRCFLQYYFNWQQTLI